MIQIIKFILSLFSTAPVSTQPEQKSSLIKKEEVKVQTNVKHLNNGDCPKCELIFNKYPGFHEGLKAWFKDIQKNHPEAHISAAGRGKADQEEFFKKGTSNAHYGQSSHNYGLAIDIFKLHDSGAEWPKEWFTAVVRLAVITNNKDGAFKINWYGEPGSPYYELPHCEVANFKELIANGKAKLVE